MRKAHRARAGHRRHAPRLRVYTSGGGLTGKTWQLTAVTESFPAFQGVVPEADQSRYTITFDTDGTYNADRRLQQRCPATYTTTGTGGLTIELGPMTMVACPEDSMSDQFVAGPRERRELRDRRWPTDRSPTRPAARLQCN